jgi:hypothetical protein
MPQAERKIGRKRAFGRVGTAAFWLGRPKAGSDRGDATAETDIRFTWRLNPGAPLCPERSGHFPSC